MYVTINPIVVNDIAVAIGQLWTINTDINSYSVWSCLNKRPLPGDQFTIKNIISPNYDEGRHSVFVCAEFQRDIGGHPCRADRGNEPTWDPVLLCTDLQGEYLGLEVMLKIADQHPQESTWEL